MPTWRAFPNTFTIAVLTEISKAKLATFETEAINAAAGAGAPS
jgi:hypothetical protein